MSVSDAWEADMEAILGPRCAGTAPTARPAASAMSKPLRCPRWGAALRAQLDLAKVVDGFGYLPSKALAARGVEEEEW